MKITKSFLKQVIKEEISKMEEAEGGKIRDITKTATGVTSRVEGELVFSLVLPTSGKKIRCKVRPSTEVGSEFDLIPSVKTSRGTFKDAKLTPQEFAEMQTIVFNKLHNMDVKGY